MIFGDDGYINFGFWRKIDPNQHNRLTIADRRRASRDLYINLWNQIGMLSPSNSTSVILEFGCGTGAGLSLLCDELAQRNLSHKLVGYDITPQQLLRSKATLEARHPDSNIRLVSDLSLDLEAASIDIFFSVEVLQCLEEYNAFADQAARVLKPGGVLALTMHLCPRPDRYKRFESTHPNLPFTRCHVSPTIPVGRLEKGGKICEC